MFRPGFTLIELLVAVSVLGLMLSLAAQIFFTAQVGVQMGTQTSQIINEQRAISQPLFDDFTNMNVFESAFGGNTPGFLVIVQEEKGGVRFPPADDTGVAPEDWLDFIDDNGNETQDTGEDSILIRSDQVAFFRNAEGLSSLTPGTDSNFDSQARAQVARVWYGHTSPFTNGNADSSIEPGDPGNDVSSQLTLGRQALLLVEGSTSSTFPDGLLGNVTPGSDSRHIDHLDDPLSENVGLYLGSRDVLNLNTFLSTPITRTGNTIFSDGGNDVSASGNFSLFSAPAWGAIAAGTQPSFFEGFLNRGTAATSPPAARWQPESRLTTIAYAEEALRWAYVNPGTRLQTAKNLSTDFENGIFTAEDIGRQHATFSPHLADFAIEIAADWIDNDGDNFPDNEPDRDEAGNLVWYTALRPNGDGDMGGDPFGSGDYDGIGSRRENDPVVYTAPFRLPSFDGVANGEIFNPFLFFGTPTSLTAPTSRAQIQGNRGPAYFVFSHSGDDPTTDDAWSTPAGGNSRYTEGSGKYWPYLVRFRYRLMDGKGDFRSIQPDRTTSGGETRVVGRWFEQIVPVKRPVGLF